MTDYLTQSTIIGPNDQVVGLAKNFNSAATTLSTAYTNTKTKLDETAWEGRRADKARSELADYGPKVSALVDELKALAGVLDKHADWITETRRELKAIENAYVSSLHLADPERARRIPSYSLEWRQVSH